MSTAIPAAEPAEAQISVTLTALILSQGREPKGVACCSGRNVDSAQHLLYYRVIKNSVSFFTGVLTCWSDAAWELRFWNLTGDAGDAIDVKMWTGSDTWLVLDYDLFETSGGVGPPGPQGPAGADGDSAYQTWLDIPNTGSEQDFLDSLKGAAGNNGTDGTNGTNGDPGLSAYEVWLAIPNVGSEQDFLDSLVGSPGSPGLQGDPGVGIAPGGSTGQVLVKASEDNYDTSWTDLSSHGIPAGGDAGQVLQKGSSDDYDANWETKDLAVPTGGGEGDVLTKGVGDAIGWSAPNQNAGFAIAMAIALG